MHGFIFIAIENFVNLILWSSLVANNTINIMNKYTSDYFYLYVVFFLAQSGKISKKEQSICFSCSL